MNERESNVLAKHLAGLKKLTDDINATTARRSTPDTRSSAPDRLGDAIRELARTMAENGRDRLRFSVVGSRATAFYVLRLVRVRPHNNTGRHPVGRVLMIDSD